MKLLLVKHSLLVCALWLLVCCTAAGSRNYRCIRIMWVSTTGEDSQRCIHDTLWLEGGPLPHPPHLNESCGSLNYVLKHTQKDTTFIVITCGLHVLEPVGSSSDNTLLFNSRNVLVVMGNCTKGRPQIQCTEGANVAFYNVPNVMVSNLSFQDCGEQLQHSDSLSNSSTLYFQDCETVWLQFIRINITGPYGRGISFVRNDTTISHGDVSMDFVAIHHFGIHGSGIHGEVLTGRTRDDPMGSENIQLNKIYVTNNNGFPSYNHNTTFTGINITVMGNGAGGEITISNVTVIRTTRGNTISIALLDRVHGFNVQFKNIEIFEERENINHNMDEFTTDSGITSHEQFSDVSKNFANSINTTSYSSINIVLRNNSEKNEFLLQNVYLFGSNSSGACKRGLQVVITGRARRNEIKATALYSFRHRTPWGGGAYIEFSGHAKKNLVTLTNSQLSNNHALRGGGIAVVCKHFATENTLRVLIAWSFHNLAKLGGGAYVILQDSSSKNTIHFTMHLSNNTAYCGGAGAYIEFSGHAMGNLVTLEQSALFHNHALRGGGIACVCRDFATQNTFKVLNTWSFYNVAKLGGGTYIILQDYSNKNSFHFTETILSNNTANCGGGMFIQIQDNSTTSRVVVFESIIMNNSLLPSDKHDVMGGGVHVEFSTVRATFRTDNIVNFTICNFLRNTAGEGVGGAISVLYKHSHYQGDSGDSVIVDTVALLYNMAASGIACAFQSLPTLGKKLFKGVRIRQFAAFVTTSEFQAMRIDKFTTKINHREYLNLTNFAVASISHMLEQLSQTINPSFQVQTNTNMIFTKSVQLVVDSLLIFCGASSQGIYALDSELVLQANTGSVLRHCVATHGGAIALYGESYIRVRKNATLVLLYNFALQRGGAIYASSAHGVVPVSNCFFQHDQEWEENRGTVIFKNNTAKGEGHSVYVSDIRNCFSANTLKSSVTTLALYPEDDAFHVSNLFLRQTNIYFLYNKRYDLPRNISNLTSQYLQKAVQREIVSGPSHVGGATVDLSKPLTMCFIPGKQKRLPYTHAYDELGSTMNSVFTVLINKMDDSIPVELNPFSKYTADFTVILHGIPQQQGMANHSFPSDTTNTSAVVKPPQLVLQSVDNKDLLLVMNIELQCCPPGYIFQYGSGNMGTCHCGMNTVIGIAECNETHPEVIGAVLERDHWAGYLPSNGRHSCDEQKFFTGPCPPGYCQTQQITLPQNNSQQELQGVVCTGSNRKGLLCGDCHEGKGIAVNFNGIRPVCVNCEEGLSKVGILVWVLSEWIPMLAFLFIFMLFNIDLVSGRFNSFLLFAQLLAFSTIRSDAELGPVHNAFVRIYRLLYGMWNLDFFGVLLPPYCLTPHAHLTLLQTLLLHYSIGLFPLTVAITLTVLERSAEKWICCHRVDQCLRRMRRWKAKYSDGMSYDRALPAFVILGFTRFLVSSSYILVNQTITGEDGEGKVVVWWQGSVPYGSIQHIAYFIPAIVILLVFVLLPSFLLLTLPIGPQLFGRLIIAVPPLRKLQRMQTFCSNVYTDRWVYHFVNVFQGCYKEHFRSISSIYLFYRIVHLLVAVFIPRAEDALRIQIILTVSLLLLIATCQPYNSRMLNTLDAAILGNLALILTLNLHITDLTTPIGTRHFYASLQMILIYLVLLYPGILLGKKVYLKCRQLRCCQKQEEQREDNAETPLEAPAERLGNLVLITELRAGLPTSEDDDTVTETETET